MKDEMQVEVQEIDSIVMTQSCDLEHGKAEIVLVCPYHSIDDWLSDLPADQQSKKGKTRAVDKLRQGHLPGYHLLNIDRPHELLGFYPVVDFRNVYGIQYQLLKTLVGNMDQRIRLLPPYREHLSQAFARYFMRVGLPQDIMVEGY